MFVVIQRPLLKGTSISDLEFGVVIAVQLASD